MRPRLIAVRWNFLAFLKAQALSRRRLLPGAWCLGQESEAQPAKAAGSHLGVTRERGTPNPTEAISPGEVKLGCHTVCNLGDMGHGAWRWQQ